MQHLLQTLDRARAFLGEPAPVPSQIPQQPNPTGRHETGTDQSVLDQLSDPHRVRDISLATRHIPQMFRIDHPDWETVLPHRIDRFPIHPGRFHPDQHHVLCGHPVRPLVQCTSHRGERRSFGSSPTTGSWPAYRGHHGVAVHVQPRTPLDQHIHPATPLSASRAGTTRSPEPADQETEVHARSSSPRCPRSPASHFFTGSRHHTAPTSGPDARTDSHPVTGARTSRHDHYF